MPMSITPSLPKPHAPSESNGRKKSLPKVKAPFVLTTMNQRGKCSLFWVWSRRAGVAPTSLVNPKILPQLVHKWSTNWPRVIRRDGRRALFVRMC